ncbi:MAG: hypothetical protein ACOYXW_12655 [Actinomycetota bacterium]
MSTAAAVTQAVLRRLTSLRAAPVDDDLSAWARRLASQDGFPLVGTGLVAATYPALQWNAERCARAGLGRPATVVLTGLAVAAEHDRDVAALETAVGAGLAAAAPLDGVPGDAVATVTVDLVGSAACAALLAGVPAAELSGVLDLAGTLLAVGAPGRADDLGARWAGHAAAAGWLAVQCFRSGLTAFDGALEHTVATVAGAGGAGMARRTPVRTLLGALR